MHDVSQHPSTPRRRADVQQLREDVRFAHLCHLLRSVGNDHGVPPSAQVEAEPKQRLPRSYCLITSSMVECMKELEVQGHIPRDSIGRVRRRMSDLAALRGTWAFSIAAGQKLGVLHTSGKRLRVTKPGRLVRYSGVPDKWTNDHICAITSINHSTLANRRITQCLGSHVRILTIGSLASSSPYL